MAERNLHINIRIGLRQVQQAVSNLNRRFNLLRSSLRAVFRTGVVAGFFAALRAGTRAISGLQNMIKSLGNEFIQLRLKATETAAIISRGGVGFTSAFEEALRMSRDLSTQVGFSAQQIQEGLVTAARSGLELQESLSVTGTAMKLATANGEEFQATLNNLIGVTRAFGVELAEIPAFADALSAAVTNSNASLAGLFEGMKNVASIASTAFGETQETIVDTTAALMTLNDAGIQGSKAGVRLRAAFQKLLGGTAKTTAAFTKYGVNLFEANAESQRFLGTLLNGQRAMAGTEERLNELKNAQFELAIAGKESSEEFQKIQDDIDMVSGKLGTLESGLDNVYRQFTLAGGKLKPFSEIIEEIGAKAPVEVIGRAFGIRGGEGIMRILNNADKFRGFKTILEDVIKESERGISITDRMYARFLETIFVGWQRIGNTAKAILSEIADGFFGAIKPILEPIQFALDMIFDSIKGNREAFKKIFEGVMQPLNHVLAMLQIWAAKFAEVMKDIFTPGKDVKLPFATTSETGSVEIEDRNVSGTVLDKLRAAFQAIGSIITASLDAALRRLSPALTFMAQVFSDAMETAFRAKAKLWENIGALIAGAMIKALIEGIRKELPSMLRSFGDLLQNLGAPESFRIGGKKLGFDVPLPNREGLFSVASKLEGLEPKQKTGKVQQESGVQKFKQSMDKLLTASDAAEDGGNKIERVGKAFIDFGDGMKEVNLEALNQGSTNMKEVFTDVERSSDNFLRATEASNEKAERALRNSERALRRAFQMQSKGRK